MTVAEYEQHTIGLLYVRSQLSKFFLILLPFFLQVLNPDIYFPKLSCAFLELSIRPRQCFKHFLDFLMFHLLRSYVGVHVGDPGPEFVCVPFFASQRFKMFFLRLQFSDALLSKSLYGVESLCISEISQMSWAVKQGVPCPPCRLEYVIEFLLQSRGFSQRPVRIFLMTEDDIFEHGLRDT